MITFWKRTGYYQLSHFSIIISHIFALIVKGWKAHDPVRETTSLVFDSV